jgi:hypothetical protein
MRADLYRIRFEYDDLASFEECNGEARPLTEEEYADAQYMKDGVPVPYAEYLDYYGNPDRHVYMRAVLESKCVCCGSWSVVDSLHSIDFMDDSPETCAIDRTFSARELAAVPGYLQDIARDMFDQHDVLDTDRPLPQKRHDADILTDLIAILGNSDELTCTDLVTRARAVLTTEGIL